MCLGSPIEPQHREAADDPGEYYRGGWSPSPLSNVPVLLKGVPEWYGLCWGLTMRTPTSKGASVEAGLAKMARVSQDWPWMSQEIPWVFRWGGANVGASLRVFRGGEASDGASLCESRGQARGVPGWWS